MINDKVIKKMLYEGTRKNLRNTKIDAVVNSENKAPQRLYKIGFLPSCNSAYWISIKVWRNKNSLAKQLFCKPINLLWCKNSYFFKILTGEEAPSLSFLAHKIQLGLFTKIQKKMAFFQTLDPYYNTYEEVIDIHSLYSNRKVTLTYNPTSGQF